ncbi:hypothetical protein [Streptomyces sp. NPDC001530]|uniref:hypothetical protein n=1 Tax=Streptomyces sp. NPDC001530 TaxID=3364582 RepID=UPI0036A5A07D
MVREIDQAARFAPAEHEFAVTTAAGHASPRGEATMQEVIDSMEVRDRIHTMTVAPFVGCGEPAVDRG